MKEDKFKRIVVGATVAAVILFVILVAFMVYQLIAISVRKARIKELEQEIAYWKAYSENAEIKIERYKGAVWLERAARKLGMIGAGDINFDDLLKDESFSFRYNETGSVLKLCKNGEVFYEIRCD